MSDAVELVLALVGLVVGIVLMIAQFQLFAIRRLLEMLVAQTQALPGDRLGSVHLGVGNPPPLTPAQLHRPADANLPPLTPARKWRNRVILGAILIAVVALLIFGIHAVIVAK